MEELYIGKIVGVHGLKGEVKIKSISSFNDQRFKKGQMITLKKGNEELILECLRHRQHKGMELVTFVNHEDINLVEKYRDFEVYGKEDRSLLGEGEYFYRDLIGCVIVNQRDEKLGMVTSIMENPRYDILVVKKEGSKNLLVPYIDAFVLEEDIENKFIKINQLEGM